MTRSPFLFLLPSSQPDRRLKRMSLHDQLVIFLYVVLAAFLSMIIGLDRERSDHPAGLRTHMLVGLGSCLFTVLSIHAFQSPGSDPARVAAQIVSGIGFLGAGAILKYNGEIKGLTTAASVWATAAVGMSVGAGMWVLAVGSTTLIWLILAVLRRVEDKPPHGKSHKIGPMSEEDHP
jgi:putative Mg2+ transporter-C (MgtC) family protein